MFGFHAFSEAPLSDLLGGIKTGNASLSSTVTISAVPVQIYSAATSTQANASVVAEVLVLKLGQANIVVGGHPFDFGFNHGFQFGGILLKGNLVKETHPIYATATIAADGTVILGDVTFAGLATLQSQTNFVGKSVLLHGGAVGFNFGASSIFDPSDFEGADAVLFTLYLDKGLDLSSYIDKERLLTLYADKSLSSTLYIDKNLSSSRYIDKELEQILVREK
jgi:hypothetical protein